MLRKKILSIVSAAVMAATVAVGGSVSAKDMGIIWGNCLSKHSDNKNL